MAEYKVKVWRRKRSRIRPLHVKEKDVETDEVSVEADDERSALDQVLRAEYEENSSKRLGVLVQVETSNGMRGFGDYGLMRYVGEEERKKWIQEAQEWAEETSEREET